MSDGHAFLELSWPIDLALTVASHGWVRLEPWRWDPETGTLSRAERIGATLGTLAMQQRDPATLALAWSGFAGSAEPELRSRAGRWVSAEWDPAAAITA